MGLFRRIRCYFIPCKSQEEAIFWSDLLNSEVCQYFLQSLIFFNQKRPINIEILSRIDFKKIARYFQKEEKAISYLSQLNS